MPIIGSVKRRPDGAGSAGAEPSARTQRPAISSSRPLEKSLSTALGSFFFLPRPLPFLGGGFGFGFGFGASASSGIGGSDEMASTRPPTAASACARTSEQPRVALSAPRKVVMHNF